MVGRRAGSRFVDDVQAMRRRVEDNIPAGARDRELKLGAGGLRDVEFAVQLLQLVHGKTEDSVRVRNTQHAIRALERSSYISRKDAQSFAGASGSCACWNTASSWCTCAALT